MTENPTRQNSWKKVREQVLERDDQRCTRCQSTEKLECDHIIPRADGGPMYDLDNLQTLCRACHQKKTAADNSVYGTLRRENRERMRAKEQQDRANEETAAQARGHSWARQPTVRTLTPLATASRDIIQRTEQRAATRSRHADEVQLLLDQALEDLKHPTLLDLLLPWRRASKAREVTAYAAAYAALETPPPDPD